MTNVGGDDGRLRPLATEDGTVYADVGAVTFIGPPVTKSGHAEARRVAFGANYVFVLNTPENLTALGLIDEAMALTLALQAKAKGRKRGRKAAKAAEGVPS
jgi:hypothetical protein